MRVDSHQHFWHYKPVRDGWITSEMRVLQQDYLPPDLLPELAASGIDARHDFIAGVVGWVDLRSPTLERRLEHYSNFPLLRGFRHIAQGEPDDRFLIREDFVRGVAALRPCNFTYDILIFPRQLPAAVALVERLPDQPFVLDHIAKPGPGVAGMNAWEDGIRALAENPRVYCKLSGLITEGDWRNWRPDDFKPYLDVVFEAFGTDRLMFGSDWPVCLNAGSYRQVKDLIADYLHHRPEADKEKIFGGNAMTFYGLKARVHESRS
jgi:L-fuconolactonase